MNRLFGKENSFDSTAFENFKTNAIDGIRIKKIPAQTLNIKNGVLVYEDKPLPFETKGFVKKLLGGSTSKTIDELTNDSVIMNDFLKNRKLNIKAKNRNASIFVNSKNELVNIKYAEDSVSPSKFFMLVDNIMNTYSDISIDKMLNNGDSFSVSFRTNTEVGVVGNEIFKTGFTLGWDGQVQFNPYILRLVCTNGVLFNETKQSVLLNGTTPTAWDNFLKNIEISSKYNFLPWDFHTMVEKAHSTKASFAEVERAHKIMKVAIGDDSNIQKFDGTQWNFNNLLNDAYTRLEKHNLNYDDLTIHQKKNLGSSLTIMNLVNELSDIASHDNLWCLDDSMNTMLGIEAGKLLGYKFDMLNVMPQIF